MDYTVVGNVVIPERLQAAMVHAVFYGGCNAVSSNVDFQET
jgi:hypothetical protein